MEDEEREDDEGEDYGGWFDSGEAAGDHEYSEE